MNEEDVMDPIVQQHVNVLMRDGKMMDAIAYETTYFTLMEQRENLINEYLDGNAHNLFGNRDVPKFVKDEFNELGLKLITLREEAFSYIPSETEKYVELLEGWYQNGSGELFHYDGVIWDVVPREDLTQLEYLG